LSVELEFTGKVAGQGRVTIPVQIRSLLGIKHKSLVNCNIISVNGVAIGKYFPSRVDTLFRITIPKVTRDFVGIPYKSIVTLKISIMNKRD